ncbi:MAG: riboflavin biosynthesis protein RibF [Prevotellaceae bacterium]|jgi:riboflavin kinase/FMN adenylyltransferase|nr:riboflavin biosynthesis protein RibF [Prevotellaceae bacterium]
MELIKDIENFKNNGLALTIGFFDGVHAGHRFLIRQVEEIAAKEGLKSAILTFDPHPRLVLDEAYKPRLLNSFSEKVELLNKLPLDYCIQLNFTHEFANYPAYEFMREILQKKLNVKHLIIGYDHRFGKNREEGFDEYCQYGTKLGIKVSRVQPYEENGFKISSSFIRRLLISGDIKSANHYLGYPFSFKGVVVEGFKLGRKFGFPTANLRLSFEYKCVPDAGVYAVWVNAGQATYGGMLYIGNRPTVANGGEPSIEVNLFDFEGDLYGKELTITFVDKIRNQQKFQHVELLKEQLNSDKQAVKKILFP